MKHVCPFCGHPIDKSWLFFGIPGGNEYVCPHCHAHIKATPLRYLVSVFAVAISYLFMMYMSKKIGLNWEWFVVVLPIVALFYFTAFWFTPGQYRLEHNGYKTKKSAEAKQSKS